jgi:diguanylate cyclase
LKQNTDWKAKYQGTIKELDARESEWRSLEKILRKAITRLSIAGRGLDKKLDQQLELIQTLSREKQDQNLSGALETLSQIVSALEHGGSGTHKKQRSDPVLLLLELLQKIQFSGSQRADLKLICSDLLKAIARGQDRDTMAGYITRLAGLINENFDSNEAQEYSAEIVFQLIRLIDIDEAGQQKIEHEFVDKKTLVQKELQDLAKVINTHFSGTGGNNNSIDEVISTLLERLSAIQGASDATRKIRAKVLNGVEDNNWPDTLNEIVASISNTLKRLNQDKRELEDFIMKVTEQLGEITKVITEDHQDHLSEHEETISLHSLMQEGVAKIKDNVDASEDISQLKSAVAKNIDLIREGVEDFVGRANTRHEAIEIRNKNLSKKITQMEKETEQLQQKLVENREKLLYDSLTGVHSRLAYEEHIEQEIARWNRHRSSFSYAIVDIDNFKQINDRYGHSAGDKALKIIANLMSQQIRKSDFIFRIGGEEFVLLLTNTAVSQAEVLVEKLRKAVNASEFHFNQERVTLSMSAGITVTQEKDDAESIFERADSALYRAKNSGRNCQYVA